MIKCNIKGWNCWISCPKCVVIWCGIHTCMVSAMQKKEKRIVYIIFLIFHLFSADNIFALEPFGFGLHHIMFAKFKSFLSKNLWGLQNQDKNDRGRERQQWRFTGTEFIRLCKPSKIQQCIQKQSTLYLLSFSHCNHFRDHIIYFMWNVNL